MIIRPTITEEQQKDILALKEYPGWETLMTPIKEEIISREDIILNYSFERGEDGVVSQKSIISYERIQSELNLLGNFLSFLENGGIVEVNTDYDVFDKPEVKPKV